MIEGNLERELEEEARRCDEFGMKVTDSHRYRQLERQLTVRRENSKPAVRHTKTALVFILLVAIPATLWVWLYVISETVRNLITNNP